MMQLPVIEAECRSCPMLSDSVFANAPVGVLDEIIASKQMRHFEPGATIFSEGGSVDGVYCLYSGSVALFKGEGNERRMVGEGHPGSLIGYREPERLGHYVVSAIAESEVTLCYIPIGVFSDQVRVSPTIALELMKSFGKRLERLERDSETPPPAV